MKIRSLKTYLKYALSAFILIDIIFALIILIVYLANGISNNVLIICGCVFCGWLLIGCFLFLLPCIFSQRTYIITDNHIEMYLKGKLIYKVRRDKIIEIRYYKIPWYMWFIIAVLGTISLGSGMEDMCDLISIRFKEYDIWQKNYNDFFGNNLKTLCAEEEESGIYEIADNFSKSEVKKICKLLNIKPQIVK